MLAVHFGAGNIGRGLIGNILNSNDYKICFIDTNNRVIEDINKNNSYKIELFNNVGSYIDIPEVTAINSINEPEKVKELIKKADIITTSVGANNLSKIAHTIKEGLLIREKSKKTINIIANENVINATDRLKNEIIKISTKNEINKIQEIAYFANSTIDRQCLSIEREGEIIASVEPYYEWVINRKELFQAEKFFYDNVHLVDNLEPFIERKLFLVNAEHAAFAYIGQLFDYPTIQEAAKDKRIYELVINYLSENKNYFITKYKMNEEELQLYIKETVKRHTQNGISDSVNRVGRDPIRKLQSDDRLVAPVKKLNSMNLDNSVGKKIIASAYLYDSKDDLESQSIQESISRNGIENTVKQISKLDDLLAKDIANIYESIKCNKEKIFEDVGR